MDGLLCWMVLKCNKPDDPVQLSSFIYVIDNSQTSAITAKHNDGNYVLL
jgi:hypothetical protein